MYYPMACNATLKYKNAYGRWVEYEGVLDEMVLNQSAIGPPIYSFKFLSYEEGKEETAMPEKKTTQWSLSTGPSQVEAYKAALRASAYNDLCETNYSEIDQNYVEEAYIRKNLTICPTCEGLKAVHAITWAKCNHCNGYGYIEKKRQAVAEMSIGDCIERLKYINCVVSAQAVEKLDSVLYAKNGKAVENAAQALVRAWDQSYDKTTDSIYV